jgi:Ca-activated chloride channel family protein
MAAKAHPTPFLRALLALHYNLGTVRMKYVVTVFVSFALSLSAQVAKQAPQESDERIRLDVTRVQLLFTVTDKKGRFVTNLAKNDFEIFETRKPQSIVEFTAETDLPLRLAILIDTSNSIRERFRFQQEAASDFVNTVIRPHEDRAVVVSFDTAPELVADLTDDTEKLNAAIKGLRPGGGTALYDAIFFACRDKLMQDQPRHKFRRAMVILSDGDDNQSRWTRDQALEMAHKADVVIYSISTNRLGIESDGDKVMKYFAEQTGGQVFFPFKAQDMAQSFENIANELRHQYNVLYRPEPLKTDGLYHPVDVKVRGRKDLVVRARHGYYAPLLN